MASSPVISQGRTQPTGTKPTPSLISVRGEPYLLASLMGSALPLGDHP